MGFLLAYSLKSAILLSILFSIYLLFVRSATPTSVRRLSLLAIYCLVIFLPLFNFDIPLKTLETNSDAVQIGKACHSQNMADFTTYKRYYIISCVLLSGIAFLIIKMISTFIYIFFLKIKGRKESREGVTIIILGGKRVSPFCFGKFVFVSESEYADLTQMVLCHEISHILRKHFLDLILSRLVTALQWWNPIAWIMQRELKDVHEFQADEDVLAAGFSRRDYQYMLLERTTGKLILTPGHGISNSRIRSRLKMMNRSFGSGRKAYRLLLFIPASVVAILITSSPLISPFLLSASRISKPSIVDVSNQKEKDSDLPWEPTTEWPTLRPESQSSFTLPSVRIDGRAVDNRELKFIEPSKIQSITVRKDLPEYPSGLIEIELESNSNDKTNKEELVKVSADQLIYAEKDENPSVTELEEFQVVAVGSYKK